MNNESIIIPTKDTPKPHNDKAVLLEAMKYRYATKKFDPKKIISDEDFETLLDAGSGPSIPHLLRHGALENPGHPE